MQAVIEGVTVAVVVTEGDPVALLLGLAVREALKHAEELPDARGDALTLTLPQLLPRSEDVGLTVREVEPLPDADCEGARDCDAVGEGGALGVMMQGELMPNHWGPGGPVFGIVAVATTNRASSIASNTAPLINSRKMLPMMLSFLPYTTMAETL